MAAMVARGSSQVSTLTTIQEKGSRNKRKFRADPLVDPDALIPNLPLCPNYGFGASELALPCSNTEHEPTVCDVCRTFTISLKQESVTEEFKDAEWGDSTETQLEEVLLANLDVIFRTAIKKITTYGYNEDVAANAVLISSACFGPKDTASNIVDHALAYLGSGQAVDTYPRENLSEDLHKLEKSVLAEMVTVLREVRPFFSRGEAMWSLLIFDMNMSHACNGEDDNLTFKANNENLAAPLRIDSSNPQTSSRPELPPVVGIPNLPSGRFSATGKESTASSKNQSTEDYYVNNSQQIMSEVKPISSRKHLGSNTKRETILRQKSVHFEKSYRTHGSRSSLRAGRASSLSSLIFDKKSKSLPDSSSSGPRNGLKGNKSASNVKLQMDTVLNHSITTGPILSMNAKHSSSQLPANSELSLSLPSTSTDSASSNSNSSVTETSDYSSQVALPSNQTSYWTPEDEKDELTLKLMPRVCELQTAMQEWTDWAQQKVMQAARRLGKEKAELQTLRQEKEEVARLKKEKQALEENTLKKLHEMENALAKASSQVDRASAAFRRLEVENVELRQEMEAARIRAEQSAVSCQQVTMREMMTRRNSQSWEKQKAHFQEELAAEKRKLLQIQQQLEQAKEMYDQFEVKRRQEEKVKEEALARADLYRKEREKIEALAKQKDESLRSKAESELQRYKDDVRKLEHQIAKMRLTTDSSKLGAFRCGLDDKTRFILEMMESQELPTAEVSRDRECVMCLTEAMSIVFLPCAHQVVCVKCNDLHQKQGMKDCPSCRTPIECRVRIRSADA